MKRTAYIFRRGLVLGWLALFIPVNTPAQIEFDAERDVALAVAANPGDVPAGGDSRLTLTLSLPPDVHITSRETGFFFVQPDSIGDISFGIASFPAGEMLEGETVYRGLVELSVPVMVAANAPPGERRISGAVGYQICTEKEPVYCTAPVERRFVAVLNILPPKPAPAGSSGAAIEDDGSLETRTRRALESGSLLALLWIYLGGLLLSFTPCVYPVIPITIAYVGARAGQSRLRALTISLVFVLGLALVYSALGVVAAATGGVFGFSTQNPWVVGLVVLVFIVMGLGMLGAFELALPSSLQTRLSSHGKTGFFGALLVGGTTGLVAAPCVGPVLVALLGWVSSTGNLLLGFVYLFIFACGLGTLFIVIGTFAGIVTALPKSGGWMEQIKHAFGLILIAAAYYFGRSLVPEAWFNLLAGAGLLMLAGYWGAFSRLEAEAGLWARLGRGVAMFALLTGGFFVLLGLAKMADLSLGTGALPPPSSPVSVSESNLAGDDAVTWLVDDEMTAGARAAAENKPLLIDFGAEWCAACQELEHKTFNAPQVAALLRDRFVTLRMDGTRITPAVRAAWSKYSVRGLPTVLIMSPDGQKEMARLEAFRPPEFVLPWLESRLATAP